MKATLEFNLPEDQNQHKQAILAPDMAAIIWSLDSFLHDGIKYGPNTDSWRTPEDLASYIRREYLSNMVDKLEC
jgi:hypothetical protein